MDDTATIAPPRDLIRSVPFELVRADSGDGLTLEGYAAVFDSPTEINSWEGNFLETIQRGAFKKTIRDRKPVLMFDHGQHPMVGQMPLGSIQRIAEDARGLHVVARLSDNWLVQPVRDAIAEGAIDGMSFRFRAIRETWADPPKRGGLRTRTLTEVSMSELGPVVMPAYRDTTVAVRGLERLLDDPDLRSELLRILGTSSDAAREGTSDDAASTETPAPVDATSRVPLSARRKRALELRGVTHHGQDPEAA